MATYSNIYIDQGSTYASVIDVKDSNGLPFNLTGYLSRGQIRKSYSSSTSTSFATFVNLPLEGKVGVSLTATQTRGMKPGRYVYDVETNTTAPRAGIRFVKYNNKGCNWGPGYWEHWEFELDLNITI